MAMRNLLLGSIAALGLSSPAAAIPLAGSALRGGGETARRMLSEPTGRECYKISGGLTGLMGVDGEYARLEEPNRAEAPFCGGRSVYQNGNDYYLYKPDGAHYGWVVSDREGMEGCLLESAGRVLYSPHGRSSPSLHMGWLAATGPDTEYQECEDGLCSELNIVVELCPPPPPPPTPADEASSLDGVLDALNGGGGEKTRAASALSRVRLDVAASTVAAALKGGDRSVPVPVQHTMKSAPTGNDHYTISGGSIRDLRGQYDRMAGSSTPYNPTCNNKSIYKKSGGDYYLFMPDGWSHWVVGTFEEMNACRGYTGTRGYTSYLRQTGSCSSVRELTNGEHEPNSCAGEWMAATGTDATGRFGDYDDCDGTWCDDPNVRVQ